MDILSWKKLEYVHFLFCVFATFGLSFYSFSRYLENGDLTVTKVSRFHNNRDAIYPSFSFCLIPPFQEEKFEIYSHHDLNVSSYQKFLQGELWDERMLDISYDNVTVSLSDNLLVAAYGTHDRNRFGNYSLWEPSHYVSYRSSIRKCFTINAPFLDRVQIEWLTVYIKNDIFPEQQRYPKKFLTYLGFPGQRLAALYTEKYDWIMRSNRNVKYKMKFVIKNINVITQRNTKQEPCFEDWLNYDQFLMDEMMLEIGCHPPHRISTYKLPLCSSATQMKKLDQLPSVAKVDSYRPPCKSIYQLDYVYEEIDLEER